MRKLFKLILVLLFIFYNSLGWGFDLFDPERNKPPEPPPVATPPASAAPAALPNFPTAVARPQPELLAQKDFVLRGISEIGQRYVVILEAPNTNVLVLDMGDKRRMSIQNGYPDYYLVRLTDRRVRIDYPENAPCRNPNPQKGIKCTNGGKSATLDFIIGQAVAVATPTPTPEIPVNPFAAAMQAQQQPVSDEEQKRREEELERRRELYRNFQRQVIRDEDVPPGMRVVRTPFGDRLVPDNR
jgi:hypothetical protein